MRRRWSENATRANGRRRRYLLSGEEGEKPLYGTRNTRKDVAHILGLRLGVPLQFPFYSLLQNESFCKISVNLTRKVSPAETLVLVERKCGKFIPTIIHQKDLQRRSEGDTEGEELFLLTSWHSLSLLGMEEEERKRKEGKWTPMTPNKPPGRRLFH